MRIFLGFLGFLEFLGFRSFGVWGDLFVAAVGGGGVGAAREGTAGERAPSSLRVCRSGGRSAGQRTELGEARRLQPKWVSGSGFRVQGLGFRI